MHACMSSTYPYHDNPTECNIKARHDARRDARRQRNARFESVRESMRAHEGSAERTDVKQTTGEEEKRTDVDAGGEADDRENSNRVRGEESAASGEGGVVRSRKRRC